MTLRTATSPLVLALAAAIVLGGEVTRLGALRLPLFVVLVAPAAVGVLAGDRPTARSLVAWPLVGVVVFVAWSLVVALWGPSAAHGLVVAAMVLATVVLAVACTRRHGVTATTLVLGVVSAALVAVGLVMGLVDVLGGGAGRWQGLAPSPNQLALLAATAILCAAVLVRRGVGGWTAWSPVVLVAAVVLAGTQSRVPVAALAVGLVVLVAPRRGRVALLGLATGAALVAGALVFGGLADGPAAAVARSGSADEVTSVTGRVELWRATLPLVAAAPVAGHGIGAGADLYTGLHVTNRLSWEAEHAHNLGLHVLLTGGVVGAAILLVTAAVAAAAARTDPDPARTALVWMTLVAGTTEAGLYATSVTWVVWAMVLGDLTVRRTGQGWTGQGRTEQGRTAGAGAA